MVGLSLGVEVRGAVGLSVGSKTGSEDGAIVVGLSVESATGSSA